MFGLMLCSQMLLQFQALASPDLLQSPRRSSANLGPVNKKATDMAITPDSGALSHTSEMISRMFAFGLLKNKRAIYQPDDVLKAVVEDYTSRTARQGDQQQGSDGGLVSSIGSRIKKMGEIVGKYSYQSSPSQGPGRNDHWEYRC
ncbi:MAG: hypothetical protein M1816_005046 [Peltula sp. TS41687]|nr:MAG: hypothetical protein M1816_005046 [Peltula sp. TS41687]